jgi:hypothetical protein
MKQGNPKGKGGDMKFHTRTRRKRLGWLALGLAVAAIGAPSAQAYYFGTEGNVPSNTTVGPTVVHQFRFTPSNEPVGPTVVIPDPTRGLPSADELQKLRFTPNPVGAPITSTPTGGIDWKDVGIGAGIAIAAMLLGAATALGLRRARRVAHS